MNILKQQNGDALRVRVEGRLDTSTSPQLEQTLQSSLDGAASLTFDFAALDYISSAGLRVLLVAQKAMNRKNGAMQLCGVKPEIMEIFEVTGFADILNIE